MMSLQSCSAAAARLIASRLAVGASLRANASSIKSAAPLSTWIAADGSNETKSRYPAAPLRQSRPFSSSSYSAYGDGGGSVGTRAYPQYNVWDSSSAMTVKPVLPSFKPAGRNGVALDKRGYMLLEFIPRSAAGAEGAGPGSPRWDDRVRFGLAAEEVGLLLDQIPKGAGVELSRQGNQGGEDGGDIAGEAGGETIPDKVLKIEPMEYGAFKVNIDLIKDGVSVGDGTRYPQTVTVQAGELELIMSLLRSALPYLLGWNVMLDAESAHRIALTKAGGRSGSGDFGGGRSDGGGDSFF